MTRVILLLLSAVCINSKGLAQTHETTSPPKSVNLQRFDPKRPPSISIQRLRFEELSLDNFLDAEETGNIKVTLSNTGKGAGHGITVKISPLSPQKSELSFERTVATGTLQAGEKKEITIPISAPFSVKSQQNKFKIEVTEANGFDADPAHLTLETRAFRAPEFSVDQAIDDANSNGIIELGESVDVTARIANKGQGDARDVYATINVENEGQNIFYQAPTKRFTIGTLKPGEFRDLNFTLVTNKRYSGDKLPVTISIEEKHPQFKTTQLLSLPLSRPIKRTTEFVVKGSETAQPVGVDVGGLAVDIEEDIPLAAVKNPDAVAVVIGIARYQNSDVPPVDFARRDATWMKAYLIKTMGFEERRVIEIYDNEATQGKFRQVFEEQLRNWVRQGRSDVFVYYSGHGVPDPETKEAYLVPYDCNPSYAKSTGYKLREVYDQLAALPARSVTIVLDACFSGSSPGGVLLKQASPAFLTVENPALAIENGLLFSSSTGQQMSNWYAEKKHGLFTYYFLKALKGAGDSNNDRQVTAEEIDTYLSTHVPDKAMELHNRKQTPQVLGKDKQRVLVKY